MKRILYLLLPACITVVSLHGAQPTTRGKRFWVSFMENITLFANGTPQFSFYISSDVNTSGSITLPSTGYTQSFTVTAGQVEEVFLPTGVFYYSGSEAVADCGFLVTSQDSIQLSVHHHRLYFSEASIILPESELGSAYMTIAHADDDNSGGRSQFVVAATEDNTTIDITPSVLTAGFRPAGTPFSVTLNKGQTYQVQAYADLTGTIITARDEKIIAVFSGAMIASVQCAATNHLYDQQYPLRSWGQQFLVVPFIQNYADQFRVLASQNGTQVFINCNAPVVLNAGEYYDFNSSSAVRITASAPVAVGQFKLGQECSTTGDATFLAHAPAGYVTHKAVFESIVNAIPGNQYTAHYVSIITRTANTSLLTLDGNPVVTFTPFGSDPAYSYARITLNTGTHTLLSDSGFSATVYGMGSYDSYSYKTGYDADVHYSSQAGITHNDTLCSDALTSFTGTYTGGASAWYWNFGDGTNAGVQNPQHYYAAPGTYNVTLLVADAGGCPVLTSQEVIVERCFYTEDCEVFVPEAFSPNEDSKNDAACVYGACIAEMEFIIYDRWGEVIFKTTDQSECWNGTYKGQPLDNAVFAWVLKATLVSGTEITKTGNITLIR